MKVQNSYCLILLVTVVLSALAIASFNSPARAQSLEIDEVYIIPYLIPLDANGERIVTIKADQPIVLGARWGACTSGLATAFTPGAAIYYEIDGVPLPSSSIQNRGYWDRPVPRVTGLEAGCVNNTDTSWFVFWRYNYGTMPVGVHSGYFHYLHEQQIPDGGDYNQDGHPDMLTVDREDLFTIVVVE